MKTFLNKTDCDFSFPFLSSFLFFFSFIFKWLDVHVLKQKPPSSDSSGAVIPVTKAIIKEALLISDYKS